MSREKEGFRDNLERLDAFFPGKEMLTVKDVARFEGCCRQTASRRYRYNAHKLISKADYARQICV